MIICSCNVLSEHQVRGVARQAKGSPQHCYALLGCQPQCGRCLERIKEILAEEENTVLVDDGH